MSPWIKPVCLVLAAVFMLSSTTESKKDEALYCSGKLMLHGVSK